MDESSPAPAAGDDRGATTPAADATGQMTGELPGLGAILRFAVPLMLGLLTTAINTLVDTLFIGRLGTAPLAAVPLAGFVYLIGWVLLVGIMRNAIAFTGRAYGAGRHEAIGPILGQYHLLALCGLPMMLLFVRAWPFYAGLGGFSPQIDTLARAYLGVRCWDITFAMLFWLYAAFYQSIGNSRFPMLMTVVVVGANILLDYGLIFGNFGLPALGVRGSALASVIAMGLGAVLMLAASHLGAVRREFALRLLVRPEGARLREILAVGVPQGLGDFTELTVWSAFMAIVGRLGAAPLAASNIGVQVTHLIFLPGFAFGMAAASYIGRLLGAGDPAAAKGTTVRVLWMGVIYMGLMGVPLWFWGEWIARQFTTDAEVVRQAGLMFKVMAAYQVFDGAGFMTRTALGGAGDTRLPTVLLALCALGVMLPAAWALSSLTDPPLVGAWLGAFAYMVAYATLMQLRLHGGRWTNIRLRGIPPREKAG